MMLGCKMQYNRIAPKIPNSHSNAEQKEQGNITKQALQFLMPLSFSCHFFAVVFFEKNQFSQRKQHHKDRRLLERAHRKTETADQPVNSEHIHA